MVDGFCVFEFIFENVVVGKDVVVGEVDNGLLFIEKIVDEVIVVYCVEVIGVMKVLNDMIVEYCKMWK